MNYEHLGLIRGFNPSQEFVGFYDLFLSTNCKSGYVVGAGRQSLRWKYSLVFATTKEVESLDCKHARRMANGSCNIEFDEGTLLDFPARYLIAKEPDLELVTRQNVKICWSLAGLIEMPRFCISLIEREANSVFGPPVFDRVRPEVLAAAVNLKPRAWDVYGFVTDDEMLAGALEIVSAVDEHVCHANVIATRDGDRELRIADQLSARFRGKIQQTTISAERIIAEVLDVGDPGLTSYPLTLGAS